jgi:hypothetical protein
LSRKCGSFDVSQPTLWASTACYRNSLLRFEHAWIGITRIFEKKWYIRNEGTIDELQIYSKQDKLDESIVNWREHIARIAEDGPPKAVISYKPRGEKTIRKTSKNVFLLEAGTGCGTIICAEDGYLLCCL